MSSVLGHGPKAEHAAARLRNDLIGWLTTVTPSGQPLPSPVWFWWDGEMVLVYSRPHTAKIRNVANNPKVSLNLDGNGRGGDIVVLEATCVAAPDHPPAHEHAEFTAKYAAAIARNGWTPESFAADYSLALLIRPHRARVW